MKYLLDTCVLSELRKLQPDRNVCTWIEPIQESHLYLSVLVLAEIQKGIAKLDESKKKQALQIWLVQNLEERFAGRILPVDSGVALEWGIIQGLSARSGNTAPVIDSLIAATAKCHNLILVTRNTADFERLPVSLVNPWL